MLIGNASNATILALKTKRNLNKEFDMNTYVGSFGTFESMRRSALGIRY